MKKYIITLLATLALFSHTSVMQAKSNVKPFVIPELKQWKGASGSFKITDGMELSTSQADAASLLPVAQAFAKDLEAMSGIHATTAVGNRGGIRFETAPCGTDNPEGYTIVIGRNITIKANTPTGAFWATRTLLQMIEQSGNNSLPKGTIVDYPDYPYRSFMFDIGRKYIPLSFLRDYVKFMAYYKMNVFHLHLNDNCMMKFFGEDWDLTPSAFRLQSDTYPGLAAESGHYTKQEFIELQKLAESNFVTIVPEIDIPAHSLAFTHYRPSLGSEKYGMDHLDLFKPEVYDFFDALFKEYLQGDSPVFRGPIVHIGTDEYSNHDPKVVEQFRTFTDHYIREVEKYGKKAELWGALTHAKGNTPVKSENVLMDCWYNGYANPADMMKQGYDIVSIPDGMVYIVPAAGYYHDYLNCKSLYENWTPAVIGNQRFEERHPQIKGGGFAVWNDIHGNGITAKDIHDRVWPAMQTLSQKMWSATQTSLPFEAFDTLRTRLSEAPDINIKGRIKGGKGLVFQADTLRSGDVNEPVEVGYPYRVEFTLNSKDNINGKAILFSSDNGTLYLRDADSGNISFEREDYRNSFDYEVPNGESVTLAFEGDNESLTLYVNGEKRQRLGKTLTYHSQDHKAKLYYVNTFFFPLQHVGNFKGTITNLKVYQK